MKSQYAVAPCLTTPDRPLPTVTRPSAPTDWIIRVGERAAFVAGGEAAATTPSRDDAAGFPTRALAEGFARGLSLPTGEKFVEPRRLDRSLLALMSIVDQCWSIDRAPSPEMQVLLDAYYIVHTIKGFGITDAGRAFLRRTRPTQRYTRTTRLPSGERVETLTVVALDGSGDIAVEVTQGTPDKPGPFVGLYGVDGERREGNATWSPVLGSYVPAGEAATRADRALCFSIPVEGTTFLSADGSLPFAAIVEGWNDSDTAVAPWKASA